MSDTQDALNIHNISYILNIRTTNVLTLMLCADLMYAATGERAAIYYLLFDVGTSRT